MEDLSPKRDESRPSPGLQVPVWIRALVSVTLLSLLFRYLDFGQLLEVLQGTQPTFIGVLFILLLLERVFSAYRWYVLLRGKSAAIAFRSVLELTFISFFLGTFIPSAAAQLLRIYVMSRAISDLALAFSSVLVERSLAVLALFLLVSLGFLAAPPGLPRALAYSAWLGLTLVILLWLWLMLPATRELTARALSSRWLIPVGTRLTKVYRRLDDYGRQPILMVWAMALAIGMQCLRVLSAYVGALALGIDVPLITFVVLVLIVIFVALLPISIGGIGVREAAFVLLLGFAGVSEEQAFALSILIYVLGLVTVLPGALLWARSGCPSEKPPCPVRDQPPPRDLPAKASDRRRMSHFRVEQ